MEINSENISSGFGLDTEFGPKITALINLSSDGNMQRKSCTQRGDAMQFMWHEAFGCYQATLGYNEIPRHEVRALMCEILL
ncbi:Hypothetical predicted protein [Octopus vulgaris]|uniref:Uncharacterized protein n=1 Tax=Octopus vulgaris TaxID=6645 RepID=A0AA36BDZ8_OCTVU|nr:Hypothetical predicted protein [Octopus vulgaris]